jgi:hypothetical protein
MNRRNVHGASFDPDTLAILPMHLPDFELLAFIGRGGYGDVWLGPRCGGPPLGGEDRLSKQLRRRPAV